MNASHVYGIVQDSKGFMWIGTSTGLLKFDGMTFKSIDLPGLKSLEILELKIDKNDDLWFLSLSNQLVKYSINNNDFQIIAISNVKPIMNSWVSDGEIGIYANLLFGAILKKDSLPTNIKELKPLKLKSKYSIHELTSDLSYRLFLDGNEIKHNIKQFLPSTLFSFNHKEYIINHDLTGLYEIVNIDGQYELEKIDFSEDEIIFNGVSLISDSELYLNTNIGIFKFTDNLDNKELLFEGINCTSSILDNENNLWISTMNNGIYFSHFYNVMTTKGLENSSISVLHEDKNKMLWIGTHDGKVFNLIDGRLSKLRSKINNEPIRFIEENNEGLIVVGKNSQIEFFSNNKLIKTIYSSKCQKKAAFLNNDTLLVGSCINIQVFNTEDLSNIYYQDIILTNRVLDAFFSEISSQVYLSTINGIVRIDQELNKFEQHVDIDFVNNDIICVNGSPNKTTWFVTNNSGIIGLKSDQKKLNLNTNNILNTNSINSLKADKNSNLWIATNSGISFVDSSYSELKHINSKDGISSDIINVLEIQNEKVYVGTAKGLSVFDLNISFENSTSPPIYLYQLLVDGERKNLDELNGRENTFRFNFQGINYSSLGKFKYKYRLKGLTDKWEIVSSSINEAIYNKIPPGEYTFEVLAINEDGVESTSPASISFNLPRPIYFRWWFVLISLCFIAGLINWLFTRRLAQINKRNELEMNLRSQQLVALKAQMKPHFISNILNSIQSHSMLQDPIKVNQYITRLSKFVRKVLKMSDATVVSLKDELEVIQTYIELEQMRSNHSFNYKMNIDNAINHKRFFIPPMLIQPYVENAIKHGVSNIENGEIVIDVDKGLKGSVIVSIEDNGLGIEQNIRQKSPVNHISVGTKKNSSRLDLLRAVYKKTFTVNVIDLSNNTNDKNGTKVQLIISNMSKIANDYSINHR